MSFGNTRDTNSFPQKVIFLKPYRIILGPPRHILHLVWSDSGISTAIKIALEVALLYFEDLPKLMIDYHVYDLAHGSYSTLPLEKYQQQQHLGFCNWTNTFEVAFAMQCISENIMLFYLGKILNRGYFLLAEK